MKRLLILLLALLVALPVAAVVAARAYLSGDAVRVRAIKAVRRATGRELAIAGPVRLQWSFAPTIEANDVSLSNPPGFPRPLMAHADRIEARIGLWPLLSRRVEIERLLIAAPDVTLEWDAQGRPNWLFTPPQAPVTVPAPASSGGGVRFQVAVGRVEVRDGRIGWGAFAMTAPQFVYDPAAGRVEGRFGVRGQSLALSGTAGPIEGASWPLNLHLSGAGLDAALSGSSNSAGLAVAAPDLAAASGLAGFALPGLRDVRLAATLSAAGVEDLQLEAGESPLGAMTLRSLAVSAPTLAGPAELRGTVAAGSLSVAVLGRAASLTGLLSGGPVTLHAATDGAVLDGTGALGGSGGTVSVQFRVGDLAALGAKAGVALPPLRDFAGAAALGVAGPTVSLTGLTATSAQGDLAGDVALTLGARPMLRGALIAKTLDLGALLPQKPPAAPAVALPTAPQATAPVTPARAIPDTKLQFAALRGADADLQLQVGEAVWGGQRYRAVAAHAVLQDGKLRVDPLHMAVGDQTLTARLEADATAQPPTAGLVLNGPGLPAGPVLALLGGPGDATGTVDLRAELHGSGDTIRSQAATLDGHAGLAMVDGQIDNAWLERLLANALRGVNLPVEAGGSSSVRCAAIRADAAAGAVQMRTMTLDTSKLKLDGNGEINLADETLDLRLRPLLRLGTSLSVPVRMRGTLLAPKVALDAGAISPGRVGITIGGAAPADTCGPALALARDGRDGVQPAPAAEQRPMKPADFLRGLLR